jgi:hypothetical protein
MSLISFCPGSRRILIDFSTQSSVYMCHLKARTQQDFDAWIECLKQHRLYYQYKCLEQSPFTNSQSTNQTSGVEASSSLNVGSTGPSSSLNRASSALNFPTNHNRDNNGSSNNNSSTSENIQNNIKLAKNYSTANLTNHNNFVNNSNNNNNNSNQTNNNNNNNNLVTLTNNNELNNPEKLNRLDHIFFLQSKNCA